MRIALCDDDNDTLDTLSLMIDRYAAGRNIALEIERFTSPDTFLKAVSDNMDELSLVFMDIAMPGGDGVDAASKLLRKYKGIRVVFTTGISNRAIDAINIHAFGYIVKPISSEKLNAVLDDFFDSHPLVSFISERTEYTIPSEKIIYIDGQGNKSAVHTAESVYVTQNKFGDWERLLPNSFFRCHKSFIVNLNHITEKTRSNCTLSNGHQISIGREYSKTFKAKCIDYLEDL